MNARRHTSALSLNLAALSLSGAGLHAATSGSAPSGPVKIDAIMKQWEYEDRQKRDHTIRLDCQAAVNDGFHKWNVASWQGVVMPMMSTKNLSPKRVAKRRHKKKLARSQRRRNRRQNETSGATEPKR